MSGDIVRRSPGGLSALTDKISYAEHLAGASLLPRHYQKQPANVLLAMELGDALGIPPIQAINEVHVIEGKPSASANLIGAMVRRAGHTLRVVGDDESATAQIIRADDRDFTFEVTWTIARARQAGLVGGKKDNWAKYPAAMLKARAITEVARTACPDALYGVSYTPEELGEVVDEEGNPIAPPAPPARPHPVQNTTPDTDWHALIEQAGGDQEALRAVWAQAQSERAPQEVFDTITSIVNTQKEAE